MRRRKEALVPHSSYDLDGDGVVAPRDYFIAKMFDKGNKHALSAEERSAAHAAIAEGLGKDSMEHYFTHRSTTAQPHKPPLTRTDKVFHKTFRVKPTHLSHTHERVIGTVHSSKERRRPLFWQPFWTVTEPVPCLLVPLSGFLASRRRKQRKNDGKTSKNGRDMV